jgi:hypothetical protein
MARVIRNFDMRFEPYPPFWMTVLLAVAIYVNFFAHHFLPDIRVALFVATVALYWRTRIWFRVDREVRWMPLPVAAVLSSLALWVAENVGTMTGTWLYTGQVRGEFVSFGKLGSWYLLLYVAFVTVTLVTRRALVPGQTYPRHQSTVTSQREGHEDIEPDRRGEVPAAVPAVPRGVDALRRWTVGAERGPPRGGR